MVSPLNCFTNSVICCTLFYNLQYDIYTFLIPFKYLDNKDGHKWQPKDWIVHQVFCNEKRCGPRFVSLLKTVTPWDDDEGSGLSRIKNGVKSFISNWFGK